MNLNDQLAKLEIRLKDELIQASQRVSDAESHLRVKTIQYLNHHGLAHRHIGAIVGVSPARVGQINKENPV